MMCRLSNVTRLDESATHSMEAGTMTIRATLDVPKPKSGGLVNNVGPFSKQTNPL